MSQEDNRWAMMIRSEDIPPSLMKLESVTDGDVNINTTTCSAPVEEKENAMPRENPVLLEIIFVVVRSKCYFWAGQLGISWVSVESAHWGAPRVETWT